MRWRLVDEPGGRHTQYVYATNNMHSIHIEMEMEIEI